MNEAACCLLSTLCFDWGCLIAIVMEESRDVRRYKNLNCFIAFTRAAKSVHLCRTDRGGILRLDGTDSDLAGVSKILSGL